MEKQGDSEDDLEDGNASIESERLNVGGHDLHRS